MENDFRFKPTGSYTSCLARQAAESVKLMEEIKERDENKTAPDKNNIIIMNSKSEFDQAAGAVKCKTAQIFQTNNGNFEG